MNLRNKLRTNNNMPVWVGLSWKASGLRASE